MARPVTAATLDRVLELLARAESYFAQRAALPTVPYPDLGALSEGLGRLRGVLTEYRDTGLLEGVVPPDPWRAARDRAGLTHPWHRGALGRALSLLDVPYGEVRTNLLAEDFLPLDLQRFQLAVYGMDNYSPQSTDWLRVTLNSGAPRAADVRAGIADDWLFAPGPDTATPNSSRSA